MEALVWKWQQIWTFNTDTSTVKAQLSLNEVSIFKLTIEEYFEINLPLREAKMLIAWPHRIGMIFWETRWL